VALEGLEPRPHREAEAGRVRRPDAADRGIPDSGDDVGGAVLAPVVHHDHLVLDLLPLQLLHDAPHRGGDRLLLVVGGDDDRELQARTLQRSTFRSWISRRISSTPYSSRQSGSSRSPALRSLIHQRWSPIRGASPSVQSSSRPAMRSQSSIASSIEQFERRPPPMLETAGARGARWKASEAETRSALWMLSRTCLPS